MHNARLVAQQVDELVVVDDGSGPEHTDVLDAVRAAGAQVVALPENVGIAAALNAGLRAADPAPEDLVVTFDQDSAVPQGFIAALVAQWDDAVRAGVPVGMVSPATFAGVPQTIGEPDERGLLRSREPIQSGSLVSGEVLATAGLLREELFIDLVDIEYFLRLQRAGRACLAVPGLDLPHELGRTYPFTLLGTKVRWRGRNLKLSLSTPFRYYFRARNRVIINREYWRSSWRLLARDTAMEVRHLVFVLMYARPRGAALRVVVRGLRDGLRSRTGAIPADVAQTASRISWRIDPL
ncbi:glycosyltransferase [Xylanimonas oleitrophica]|uniref:glycosyltransferase n=1 Tax=Xylanimonas oleitrophica TaxID=2607479 RepID=UPI0015D08551|nr:glycosyltransferase [Xylanimonas oleitrophica]